MAGALLILGSLKDMADVILFVVLFGMPISLSITALFSEESND